MDTFEEPLILPLVGWLAIGCLAFFLRDSHPGSIQPLRGTRGCYGRHRKWAWNWSHDLTESVYKERSQQLEDVSSWGNCWLDAWPYSAVAYSTQVLSVLQLRSRDVWSTFWDVISTLNTRVDSAKCLWVPGASLTLSGFKPLLHSSPIPASWTLPNCFLDFASLICPAFCLVGSWNCFSRSPWKLVK